jgi:hypothetical protein
MEYFKLLKGYKSEIIVSELNDDLTISLNVLPDNMLKIQMRYVLTPYDIIELERIIKMRLPFCDYTPYIHYVLSDYHLIKELLENDIMDTLKFILNSFDD